MKAVFGINEIWACEMIEFCKSTHLNENEVKVVFDDIFEEYFEEDDK